MENYLEWWEGLTPYERDTLAEEEHWTTPDQLTNEQIKELYLKDDY